MSGRASLRARMTLWVTAGFTVFALVADTGFLLWATRTAHRDAEERVRAAARLVAYEWNNNAGAHNPAKAFAEAREDMRLDDVSIILLNRDGRFLGANQSPPLPWPAARQREWVIAEAPAENATVIAGMLWNRVQGSVRRELGLVLTLSIVITGGMGIVAWILVGRTLRPIGTLSDQANTATADPLHARLSAPSEDAEVRRLVDTLNGFLERLGENTRAREQFYAAAAHELRSPLAVLSGSVEVALSRPRESADYQETLTDLQQQTRRLTTLVEGLLTLNRLDMHADIEASDLIDLGDLCQRTLALLAPLIAERYLAIKTDFDASGDVHVPPTHAAILTRNLIENAVKYASIGGTVAISLSPTPAGIQFRVYNDYPDADSLPLENLGQPFYRADASRSAATGGNGLGLAICRRINDLHDWRLKIQREPQGISVTVTIRQSQPSR